MEQDGGHLVMYIRQVLRSARGSAMNVGMIPVGCVTTILFFAMQNIESNIIRKWRS
jgi:hypothetical protein